MSSKQASKASTGIVELNETEYIGKASEAMRPDGESLVMIDTRRLETIEDLQSACKNVHGIAQAAVETAGRRAIVANTSIGRGLIWGYTAVCDYAGKKQEERTAIEDLTAGKIAAVLGINNDNCERLYGVSWGALNACVELGRADDHDQREAELLLADEGKSVTVKSLRAACNAVLHPDLGSNRADGARRSAAAAVAALTGASTEVVLSTGVKATEVTKLTNRVAASLIGATALNAASDDRLKATKWAIEQVLKAREAGTLKRTAPPEVKSVQGAPVTKRAPRKAKAAA